MTASNVVPFGRPVATDEKRVLVVPPREMLADDVALDCLKRWLRDAFPTLPLTMAKSNNLPGEHAGVMTLYPKGCPADLDDAEDLRVVSVVRDAMDAFLAQRSRPN